jgi:hypothetical protein
MAGIERSGARLNLDTSAREQLVEERKGENFVRCEQKCSFFPPPTFAIMSRRTSVRGRSFFGNRLSQANA